MKHHKILIAVVLTIAALFASGAAYNIVYNTITARTSIELGSLADTTITRTSAGDLAVESNKIYRVDGNDVDVADGGTGVSTLTDGGILLGSGANDITAMSVLADGEMIVGDGTTDPVAESGATLRTSIGVGTSDTPTLAGLNLTDANTTLTGSGGVLSVEGKTVNNAYFNIDDYVTNTVPGTTDCNVGIQACFDAADAATGQATVYFPAGTYATGSGVTLQPGNNLIMDGLLTYIGDSNETCLTIGAVAEDNIMISLKLRVEKSVLSDWTSEDCIGIQIINASRNSDIIITEAAYFTIGVELLGDAKAFEYNTIYLGYILNNKIGLQLDAVNAGAPNENLFIGGSFAVGAVNTTLDCYGVKIVSSDDSYHTLNNNIFMKPCFEFSGASRTGNGYCLWYEDAYQNHVYNARSEGNDYFVKYGAYSTRNISRQSYGDELNIVDASTNGDNHEYMVKEEVPRHLIFDSGDLVKRWCPYNATLYMLAGIDSMETGDTVPQIESTYTRQYPDNDYVSLISGSAIGVSVDTITQKQFSFQMSGGTVGGRVFVKCYDSADALLTSAGGGHPYVRGTTGTPYSWTANLGGGYLTGSDSFAESVFSVGSDVKRIWIGVSRGSATTEIAGFRIYGLGTNQNCLVMSASDVPIVRSATLVPDRGAFELGAMVQNAEPGSGEPDGWINTSRVDSEIKTGEPSGETVIDVDSTTGMLAGDVIGIELDDGTWDWSTIVSVDDADTVTITDVLTDDVAVDNDVVTTRFLATGYSGVATGTGVPVLANGPTISIPRFTTTDDTSPTAITNFDGRHSVFGESDQGLAISYSNTNDEVYLTAIHAGTAWKDMKFQAQSYDWYCSTLNGSGMLLDTNGNLTVRGITKLGSDTDNISVSAAGDMTFTGAGKITGNYTGSTTWDPGSIAVGAMEAVDITVTGAALGEMCLVSFSLDVTDLALTANVTATNTVTAVLSNNTGGAVDLASGTIAVKVFK
jgi:hypothetical protein